MADHCQMLRSKAKKTRGCKGASDTYLVKGMNTYAMYLFSFLLVIYTKLLQLFFFALSIWCMK